MERRRARPRLLRLIPLASALLVAGTAASEGSPPDPGGLLALILAARAGLAVLEWDPVLARCAALYAEELGERGELSHAGRAGDRVIDRVRRQGATDARVGEILGAAAGDAQIVEAWLASPTHREVLRGAGWTHVGIGIVRRGGTRVYVVVFAARGIEDLVLLETDRPLLRGRLVAPGGGTPVLLVDAESRRPLSWDPDTGWFVFALEQNALESGYLRLGFATPGGEMEVTDVLHRGARLPRSGSLEARP